MKERTSTKAIARRRQAKLDKLGQCGPFVLGSLNRVERKDKEGGTKAYYLLTFKEAGKTRSVYVPQDMVKEVREWLRNYQKLKKAMALVSADSIALIRNHVPARRAANVRRPRQAKKP